jgi:hypothetical protein
MSEGQSRRIPFELIIAVQRDLERRGYYFFPVEKEHTEALVTQPLAARLRRQIKKRGFARMAGRAIVTFSGYEDDPREIYEVPEIRSYFRRLDAALPELPALLTYLPELGFNGPGLYLLLLGEVDAVIPRPERGGYDAHVKWGVRLIEQALYRVGQACTRFGLSRNQSMQLTGAFLAGSTHRFP